MQSLARRTLALLAIDQRRHRRKHGGGPASAGAGPTTYASDSFNRADGAIGTADVGGAWTDPSGFWAVASNLARITSAVAPRICYVDDGQADGTHRIVLNVAGVGGIMFRRVDDSNYLATAVAGGLIRLRRITAGVSNTIGTGGAAVSGDTVKVVCTGSAIDVYLNDVLQFSATEAQGQTSTMHGLYATATAIRHDDWSHKSA